MPLSDIKETNPQFAGFREFTHGTPITTTVSSQSPASSIADTEFNMQIELPMDYEDSDSLLSVSNQPTGSYVKVVDLTQPSDSSVKVVDPTQPTGSSVQVADPTQATGSSVHVVDQTQPTGFSVQVADPTQPTGSSVQVADQT